MKERTLLVVAAAMSFAACSSPPDESDLTKASVLEPDAEVLESTASIQGENTIAFIPSDFDPPTLAEHEDFKLVPLGPALTKIDYDAYMSSVDHLQQTFTRSTRWPRHDLTEADAILDMATEEARFNNRESFAYGVLTPDGTRELGSVYVQPSTIPGYDAIVKLWVSKADFDRGLDSVLFTWVQDWIAEDWPFMSVAYPGRTISWEDWDRLEQSSERTTTQ